MPSRCTAQGNVYGHAWDDVPTPADYPRHPGEAVITLRCTRCRGERIDIVTQFSGALIARRYVWESDAAVRGLTMDERRLALLDALRAAQTVPVGVSPQGST